MATITLEYDFQSEQTQKTLDFILSSGLFKQTLYGKEEQLSEKRKKLDNELKDFMVDFSNYKFNREEANIYE